MRTINLKKTIIILMSTTLISSIILPSTVTLATANDGVQFENVYSELTKEEIANIQKEYKNIIQNESNLPQQRGVASVTTKALKAALKKYGVKIARKIGGKTGTWLEKNLSKVIKGLDYAGGKARGALKAVLKGLGLSESTADLWADIIITAVELFL